MGRVPRGGHRPEERRHQRVGDRVDVRDVVRGVVSEPLATSDEDVHHVCSHVIGTHVVGTHVINSHALHAGVVWANGYNLFDPQYFERSMSDAEVEAVAKPESTP